MKQTLNLTKPITTGTLDEREEALKKQGARLMTFADIKKIYATNDKKNIALLKQDMEESWVLIRAEKEYDEETLKKMADGKEIKKWYLSNSNWAVRFLYDFGWFHVDGISLDNGLSRGVRLNSIKQNNLLSKDERKNYKRALRDNKRLTKKLERINKECEDI